MKKNSIDFPKINFKQNSYEFIVYSLVISVIINISLIFLLHNYKVKLLYLNKIIRQNEHYYEGKKLPFPERYVIKRKSKYNFFIFINGNDCNKCLRIINKSINEINEKKFNIIYVYSDTEIKIPNLSKYKMAFNIHHPIIADTSNIINDFFNTHVTPICVVTNKKQNIIYVHKPSWEHPNKTVYFFKKIKNL